MDTTNIPESRFCSECGRAGLAEDFARFGDQSVCPDCKDRYAQKLREGVAPMASVPYAGFWLRVLALLIDAIILMVVQTIIQFAVGGGAMGTLQPDPEHAERMLGPALAAAGLAWLIGLVVGCTYESLFVSRLGATPGKMALGLKVVRPNGELVDLGRAIGRYFAKMLSWIILGIGYIMVAFDAEKRGLHDLICDTRVIKTRG